MLAGATTPGELAGWLRATGVFSTVRDEGNWTTSAGLDHATGGEKTTGDVGGDIRRTGLFRGDQGQPEVQILGPVCEAPNEVATGRGLSGGDVEAGEQVASEMWTHRVSGGGDPSAIVLGPSTKGVDQFTGGGFARPLGQGEEIGRGRLEADDQFALGVLHAGCEARIEVEPAHEHSQGFGRRFGGQTFDDHSAMRLEILDQLAPLAPGDAGAGGGEGGQALVDLQGQKGGPGLGGEFQPEPALQVGVAGSGLDQQVGQARRAKVDQAGSGKPGRDP